MTHPETTDAIQLLTWLDEQHREDRQQLYQLRKIAESQAAELEALTKRFEDLERRLSSTQAQLVKFPQIEAALAAAKEEIVSLLEESQAQLQHADARLDEQISGQQPEILQLNKTLQAMQEALSVTEGQVTALPTRIEAQIEQATVLAKDIESLEKRFIQTQAQIVALSERVSSQSESMATLSQHLEELEGRLNSTQAQLVKFTQIKGALQEVKNEIVLMLRDMEERWKAEAREAAELRRAEQESTQAALHGLEKRLEALTPIQERMKALAADDDRLRELIFEQAANIPPLQESSERHADRLSYLEEDAPRLRQRLDALEGQVEALFEEIQNRTEALPAVAEQLARTSARVAHLEPEIPKLQKVDERLAGKMGVLEEWAQRSAEKIDELEPFESRIEQVQTAFIEEIRRGEERRNRRLLTWEQELVEHRETLAAWQEVLRRYEISHQDNRRLIEDLRMLPDYLERGQREAAERQRVAEEQLQHAFEAWQQENEKRWRLFLKKRDYDWTQQHKVDAGQDERLAELETWWPQYEARIAQELDRLDERDRQIHSRVVSLLVALNKLVARRVVEMERDRENLAEELKSVDFED